MTVGSLLHLTLINKNPDLNPHQLRLSLFHWRPFNTRKARNNTHTQTHTWSHSLFPICDNSYKTPVILSHTQAGSQHEPTDQVNREKLWRFSNVMGFDVDAELHYGTPMKSETSFHLPASYAENVGRKHASLQLRFLFLVGKTCALPPSHTQTHSRTSVYFCLCEDFWSHNGLPNPNRNHNN